MYSGYKLTEKSRAMLLKKFPPQFGTVICEHITKQFPCRKDDPAPDMPASVKVVGTISGAGVQGLLVEIDGSSAREDGSKYHITVSIDKAAGIKPVDTNKYVKDSKYITPVAPINIDVIPKNFHNKD